MIKENDWRLQGQMKYLYEVELKKRNFDPKYPGDHDHCEFCTKKFMYPSDTGYCFLNSANTYSWICEACFEDFMEMFKWKAIE